MSFNQVPRRIRVDLFTPAEKAIYDAAAAVEALPAADVRLTRACMKLQEARELVADYVDGVAPLPTEGPVYEAFDLGPGCSDEEWQRRITAARARLDQVHNGGLRVTLETRAPAVLTGGDDGR